MLYSTLFSVLQDAIILVQLPDGKLLDANEKALTLLGYSREHLSGKAILSFIPESDKQTVSSLFRKDDTISTTHPVVNFITSQNRFIPLEVIPHHFADDGREFVYLVLRGNLSVGRGSQSFKEKIAANLRKGFPVAVLIQHENPAMRFLIDFQSSSVRKLQQDEDYGKERTSLSQSRIIDWVEEERGQVLLLSGASSELNRKKTFITASVAIIDKMGTVTGADDCWKEESELQTGFPGLPSLGEGIFERYQKYASGGNRSADYLLQYLYSLVKGEIDFFSFDYPDLYLSDSRWFTVIGYRDEALDSGFILVILSFNAVQESFSEFKREPENLCLPDFSAISITLSIDGAITSYSSDTEPGNAQEIAPIIGRSFSEFVHPVDLQKSYEYQYGILKGEKLPPTEIKIMIDNSGFTPCVIKAKPLFEMGKICGLLLVARNLNDFRKKQPEPEDQNYFEIIDRQAELIIIFTTDLMIKHCNDAFAIYAGFSKEALIGSSLLNLIPKQDHPVFQSHIESMLESPERTVIERRMVMKHNAVRWQRWVVTVQYNQETSAFEFQAAGIDITELKSTEQALSKSSHRYKFILDNSSDIFMLFNREGTLTYVNTAIEKILGFTPDEFMNPDKHDMIPPEAEGLLMNAFSSIIKHEGDPYEFEAVFYHKDGSQRTLAGSGINSLNDQNIEALVIRFHDITARVQAEKTRLELRKEITRLSYVASQITSSVIITNLNSEITWVNSAFEKLTGYTFDEVKGTDLFSILFGPGSSNDARQLLTQHTLRDESLSARVFCYGKSPGTFWGEIVIDPMRNELHEKIGSIFIVNNITEAVNQEQHLRAAKDKAEEMNRIKNNFLANLSHELRTPMIGILGYAEMLIEDLSDEEQQSMASVIFSSGQKLLETLNLLLDLSKIEAHNVKPDYTEFDLVPLLYEIAETFNQEAAKKGISFFIHQEVSALKVYLDIRLVKIIVSNLINNAIKFTQVGSVTVSMETGKVQDCECAIIRIIDTGIGIPEESMDLIFEEFRQVSEGYNRSYEGTGLGLTVTKKFVDILNGKIDVTSKMGEGTTFMITLPASPHLERERRKIPRAPETKSDVLAEVKRTNLPEILYVEDDPTSRKLIPVFLNEICRVDTVEDGASALQAVQAKKYAAVIMDINLGSGMNGLETAKAIRKLAGYETIPIGALTAYALKGDREKFLSEGCSDYLSKPFERLELLEFVQQLLKK